jgi:hypothetical protein
MMRMRMDLYQHQQKALEQLSNGKILWGGVGTGKSLVAMAYYKAKEAPKSLYVITTAKKRDSLDWEAEGARMAIGTVPEATVAGVLTVDSWNNIKKYEEVENAFFIFDEQRLVGSGAWTKSFIRIAKANNWILLSATPGDTWLDYIPVFVANGYYKNRTEFKREHVVYNHYSKFPKVDHYVGEGKLHKLRRHLLVEMPYERHTTRHAETIFVEHDKELFDRVVKDRWHVYENRPIRDVSELFIVMRKVANSHESRLSAIRGLMEKHPKLIVFYNFDYELELLRTLTSSDFLKSNGEKPIHQSTSFDDEQAILHMMDRSETIDMVEQTQIHASIGSSNTSSQSRLPMGQFVSVVVGPSTQLSLKSEEDVTTTTSTTASGSTMDLDPSFAIAEWNGHKHQEIPETDRWVYLVQYVAGSEGWNCVETDAMVFYSLTYSYKNFHQAHGRIDRLNTGFVDLHYYTLLSKSMIDRAVMGSLRKKKSFNESKFAKVLG